MADVTITTELDGIQAILSKLGSLESRLDSIASSNKKVASSAKEVENNLKEAAIQGAAFGHLIADAAEKAAHALIDIVKETVKYGDELGKMSERTGISVETLSKLDFAAKVSGTSLEALRSGVSNLSRNLIDFQRGGKATSAILSSIGIDAKDASGHIKPMEDILLELADKFAGAKDGAEKTGIAVKLFGQSVGPQLIPFLNQGSAGIDKLMQRAVELGAVIDDKTAKAATEFQDNLADLETAVQSIGRQIAIGLLPYLVDLTNELKSSSTEVAKWREVGGLLGEGLKNIAIAAVTTVQTFQALTNTIGGLYAASYHLAHGAFSDAKQAMIDAYAANKALDKAFDDTRKTIRSLGSDLNKLGDNAVDIWGGIKGDLPPIINPTKLKSARDPLKELNDEIGRLNTEYLKLSQGEAAAREFELTQGKLAKATGAAADALRDQIRAIDAKIAAEKRAKEGVDILKKLDAEMAKQQADQIDATTKLDEDAAAAAQKLSDELDKLGQTYESAANPMIAYGEEVDKLTMLWETGRVSLDAYTKGVEVANTKFNDAMDKLDASKLTDFQKDLLSATKGFSTAFSKEITDMVTSGNLNFKNFFKSVEKMILNIGNDLLVAKPISDAANTFFKNTVNSLQQSGGSGGSGGGGISGALGAVVKGIGGLFGGGGGAASGAVDIWEGIVAHAGGVVGQSTFPTRMIPASMFANAPRLHSGGMVGPGEVPAILQKGEQVIPRGSPGGRGGFFGTINVNVPSDTPRQSAQQTAAMTGLAVSRAIRRNT